MGLCEILLPQSGGADRSSVLLWMVANRKTFFSHLKHDTPKKFISVQVHAMFRIFSRLYLTVTAFSNEELKLFTLGSKPPNSTDKNNNFTLQYTGVAGPPLPQFMTSFVLLCDFD